MITKSSGPRVVWLLGRKKQLTIFWGLKSSQKEQLPQSVPKRTVSMVGGSAENTVVLGS
jgi:hypothetical protein